MNLSKKEIISDFEYIKRKAKYNNQKNIEDLVIYSELAAKIAYHFNFKYCDDELEDNIIKIAKSLLNFNINFKGIPERIAFYDSFSMDNRGLTQQYLRAIFSWNCEILYITPKKTLGQQIFKELHEYSKSHILILSENSFEKNIKLAANSIIDFKPEKSFLHFSPWDILGISLWSQINSSTRFFINLTDHAFWLGKSCIDYSIEFRNYGLHVSKNNRGIADEKLLFQPYYPIISENSFKGFPVNTKDKIIAFAGSNYYKIYGEDFILLKMIKEVLSKNQNLVFLFAGTGDEKPFKDFIMKHHLEERIFLIGNRSDISEVIQHIDIYVNTYPMIGGLMSQYAAKMNKPIIGYSDLKLYSFNNIEDLLNIENKGILIKNTKETFIQYFNELIRNNRIRIENITHTKNSVLEDYEFNQSLRVTIEQKISKSINYGIINDEAIIFETYLDMENNYLKNYYNIIYSTLRHRLIFFRPTKRISHLFRLIIKKMFVT